MANLFKRGVIKSSFVLYVMNFLKLLNMLCSYVPGLGPFGYKVDMALITTSDMWLLAIGHMKGVNKRDLTSMLSWIPFALWPIWKNRCAAIYEHVTPSPLTSSAVLEFATAKQQTYFLMDLDLPSLLMSVAAGVLPLLV